MNSALSNLPVPTFRAVVLQDWPGLVRGYGRGLFQLLSRLADELCHGVPTSVCFTYPDPQAGAFADIDVVCVGMMGWQGFWDCKTGDANQQWVYDPHAGASLFKSKKEGTCLVTGHGN